MEYQDNWLKVKERLNAFWHQEIIDRCCIVAEAPRRGRTIPYEATFEFRSHVPEDQLLQYWTDPEYILKNRLLRFENTFYGGEAFPSVFLDLGASGHAGFFKGSQHQFGNGGVWFHPWITDPETQNPVFDPDAELYRKNLELARYFAQHAGGRFFISMPDTADNLDALAHMRGATDLLMDLYDNREWVVESLETIQRVWAEFIEQFYQIVSPVNEGGSCVSWLNAYVPGRMSQTQCDFSVMISPEDYAQLVAPELRQQLAWMDYGLYHLDGSEQVRHLDTILSLEGLNAIQWTCVTGQPSPLVYLDVLRRIQAAGKSLIIPCFNNPKDVEPLLENLSSKGLMIIAPAQSQDEAEALVKLAEKHTHE